MPVMFIGTGASGRVLITLTKFKEKPSPLPFIPSERELDQLIVACNPYYASFLQMMKETGFRPGKVQLLKLVDIDFENRVVTLNSPL